MEGGQKPLEYTEGLPSAGRARAVPDRSMVPMTATPLLNLSALIDDAKCFELVRQCWPWQVSWPVREGAGAKKAITKTGSPQPTKQPLAGGPAGKEPAPARPLIWASPLGTRLAF